MLLHYLFEPPLIGLDSFLLRLVLPHLVDQLGIGLHEQCNGDLAIGTINLLVTFLETLKLCDEDGFFSLTVLGMARAELLGEAVTVLEVGREEHVDSHHDSMGFILAEFLDGMQQLLEVERDLLCDVFLELDQRKDSLCGYLPHEISGI